VGASGRLQSVRKRGKVKEPTRNQMAPKAKAIVGVANNRAVAFRNTSGTSTARPRRCVC
jgi:hypothetical protein